MRGLTYYTGVVFEGFDRSGQLRAIFGGGRYDELLSTFGGSEDLPAVGFGFGDAVIIELLKMAGKLPTLPPSVVDIVVFAMEVMPRMLSNNRALLPRPRRVPFHLRLTLMFLSHQLPISPTLAHAHTQCTQEELRPEATKVAAALRGAGRRVDLILEPRKTKSVFKHADRLGADYVALIAPDEAARGVVRIKRLSDSEQYDVRHEDLTSWLALQARSPELSV